MKSCNSETDNYTGELKCKRDWCDSIRLPRSSKLCEWLETETSKHMKRKCVIKKKRKCVLETQEEVALRRAKELKSKGVDCQFKKSKSQEPRKIYPKPAKHAAKVAPLPTIQVNTEVRLNTFEDVDSSEIAEYKKLYPILKNITDRLVHCTSCNMHIGTAPISETIIKMHPVLRVIQCKDCYTFYTSGEFIRGLDGSEYYCRWCGQGGEVFCCSKCPKVFCRNCIELNVSKSKVIEIQENENWICFACNPACIIQLRADYWALSNFIDEKKRVIENSSLTEKEVNEAMRKDCSKCCLNVLQCINKKRKLSNSIESTPAVKRIDSEKSLQEPAVHPVDSLAKRTEIILPIFKSSSGITIMPRSCNTSSSTSKTIIHSPIKVVPVANTAQPFQTLTQSLQAPLQSGQNLLLDILTASQAKNIVFHTNNGFRVDLNRTGEQESYLLQNGKLIQVEKQQTSTNNFNVIPSISRQIVTSSPMENSTVPRIAALNGVLCTPPKTLNTPILRKVLPLQPQPLPPVQQSIMSPTLHKPSILPVLNNVQKTQNIKQITSKSKTNIKRKKKEKPIQINPAAATAKSQFEIRVKNSLEVCQQIIGKLKMLTKSTTFKSIKTVSDVKDLIMHLSYLLTYGSSRFKTLQEKFRDDMKLMDFDPDSLNSDDDIEILEPNTTLIDLDSDQNDPDDLELETRKSVRNLINAENIVSQKAANVVDTKSENDNNSSIQDQNFQTNVLSSGEKHDTNQNMNETTIKENITNPIKTKEVCTPIVYTVEQMTDEITIEYMKQEFESEYWNSNSDLIRNLLQKSDLSQNLNEQNIESTCKSNHIVNENEVGGHTSECRANDDDNILKDRVDKDFNKLKVSEHLNDISETMEDYNLKVVKTETDTAINLLGTDTNPVIYKVKCEKEFYNELSKSCEIVEITKESRINELDISCQDR